MGKINKMARRNTIMKKFKNRGGKSVMRATTSSDSVQASPSIRVECQGGVQEGLGEVHPGQRN